MAPPPPNENERKDDETKNTNNNDNANSSSQSSSWFGSWFEGDRDMRNEIHEQLNDFETRQRRYEEQQQKHQQFLDQHAASSSLPFPFFVSPEHDHGHKDSGNRDGTGHNEHKDDFEDVFGGRIPRASWQGAFDGGNGNGNGNNNNGDVHPPRDPSIDDLQRELQNFFEASFSGGMIPPSHDHGGNGNSNSNSNRGWTSSSTTVISNSNGTSYTMKQDSKNGARVDLRLPKKCHSENVSVEVLRDHPCRIRWRNHSENTGIGSGGETTWLPRTKKKQHEQVLELGDSVDCSRLSASISEATQTLTVEAPSLNRDLTGGGGGGKNQQVYPRPVTVTKKN